MIYKSVNMEIDSHPNPRGRTPSTSSPACSCQGNDKINGDKTKWLQMCFLAQKQRATCRENGLHKNLPLSKREAPPGAFHSVPLTPTPPRPQAHSSKMHHPFLGLTQKPGMDDFQLTRWHILKCHNHYFGQLNCTHICTETLLYLPRSSNDRF